MSLKSYKLWAATVTEVSQVMGPCCHWNLTSYGPHLSLKSYKLWATTVTKVWQVMGHYCHTQDLKITSCQFYCHTRCTSHFPIKVFVTHIIYFLYYAIGLIVIHVFWISFGVFLIFWFSLLFFFLLPSALLYTFRLSVLALEHILPWLSRQGYYKQCIGNVKRKLFHQKVPFFFFFMN